MLVPEFDADKLAGELAPVDTLELVGGGGGGGAGVEDVCICAIVVMGVTDDSAVLEVLVVVVDMVLVVTVVVVLRGVPDAWVLVEVTVLGAGAWLDVKVLLEGLWLVSTTVVVVVGAAAVLELSDGADTVLVASAGAGANAVLRVKLAVAVPAVLDMSLELGKSVVVLAAVMGAVIGTAMTTGDAGLAGELPSESGVGDAGAAVASTVTGLLTVTADTGTPDAASCRLIIGSCSCEGLNRKYSSAGPSARNSSTSHRCMAAALGTCRLRKRPLAAHWNRPWLLAGTLTPVTQAGLVEPSCTGCSPNLISRPSTVQFPI